MRLIGVETEEFTDAVLNMVVHMRGGLVADEEEKSPRAPYGTTLCSRRFYRLKH